MAFEDPAEEELDYDNDDALDPAGLPGHAVLEEEDLDDDEDYEDLYGDVNVGMYAPAAAAPAPPPSASNAPNGDLEMESLNDDENGDLKDTESGEPAHDYLPDDSAKAMMDAPPKLAAPPKLVVMKPGANGGDAGRGWPAGSGPAAGRGLLYSCYPFSRRNFNFHSEALCCMLETTKDLGFPHCVGISLCSFVSRFFSRSRAREGGKHRSILCNVLLFSAIERFGTSQHHSVCVHLLC